jgi:hypothetical protein
MLAPAPVAQGKGIARATVCGADGCADITRRAQARSGCAGCSGEQLMSVLEGSARPARRAPYVRLVLALGAGGEVVGRERILWVPELRLTARDDGDGHWSWFRPTPSALAVAARLTRDVRPYPASSMPFEPPARAAATAAPAPRTGGADGGDGDVGLPVLGGAALAAALALGAVVLRRRRGVA